MNKAALKNGVLFFFATGLVLDLELLLPNRTKIETQDFAKYKTNDTIIFELPHWNGHIHTEN